MIVERLGEVYDISHCAIVCKDRDSIYVIHSVSQSLSPYDGVQSQELDPFIHDSKENSVIVVRYKSKYPERMAAISANGQNFILKSGYLLIMHSISTTVQNFIARNYPINVF